MDTAVRAQDEWLALRCQSGEPDAFEDLVHVMERPLLYYAVKLLGNEDAAAVHRALDQIDLRHREVLVLHFLEDFSVAEVAAVIGCPEGTVKSRMYHAKKAMKEILRRGGYGTKQ